MLGIVIDANGNTLSDPSGKSYTWDFENRLTQAVVPGIGTVTSNTIPLAEEFTRARRPGLGFSFTTVMI